MKSKMLSFRNDLICDLVLLCVRIPEQSRRHGGVGAPVLFFVPSQLMLQREFGRAQPVQPSTPSFVFHPPALSLPSITPDCI